MLLRTWNIESRCFWGFCCPGSLVVEKYPVYIYMERGLAMLLHAVIIGFILYLLMVYLLGQRQVVAENRSILAISLVLLYMILFGHGLPTKINNNLF